MGENLIYLVEKCKNKDSECILTMFKKFNPLIRKYEKLLHYEDAKYDLQEKLLFILYHIPVCQVEFEVLSYVKTSMYRAYIKLSEKNQHYNNTILLTDDFDNYESFFDIDRERCIDLMQALEKLTTNQKTVIIYRFLKGYGVNQIAELMKISRQAVNKNERKALDFLRSCLIYK